LIANRQKKLKQYVEEDPESIRKKSEVMIEHFLLKVIAQGKINREAKAMVVSNSIKSAIYYKIAFDKYLREKNLIIRLLLLFLEVKK
jgi:hypothetical protein